LKSERKCAIILHGGAGDLSNLSTNELGRLTRATTKALERGFELTKGKTALDGVQDAVLTMENSGLFNAGIGSVLTLSGRIEMDAAIMSGRNLSCGAVGAVSNVRNPILLARRILEETDHSLVVGSMAKRLAEKFGLAGTVLPSNKRREKWKQMRENPAKYLKKNIAYASDTVGAVAIDAKGNIASGVSTGGLWLKLDGRVGDSALVGAGLYAENGVGGVAATGIGEAIMNVLLAKIVHGYMAVGKSVMDACKFGIENITAKKGPNTAGLVAIDSQGNFGYALNTKTMIVASMSEGMDRPAAKILTDRSLA